MYNLPAHFYKRRVAFNCARSLSPFLLYNFCATLLWDASAVSATCNAHLAYKVVTLAGLPVSSGYIIGKYRCAALIPLRLRTAPPPHIGTFVGALPLPR
jgi:hypothetical protein